MLLESAISTHSFVSVQYATVLGTAGVKVTVMCDAEVPNLVPTISIRLPVAALAMAVLAAVMDGLSACTFAIDAEFDLTHRTATIAVNVPALASDMPKRFKFSRTGEDPNVESSVADTADPPAGVRYTATSLDDPK
jgi:hypothetical protein